MNCTDFVRKDPAPWIVVSDRASSFPWLPLSSFGAVPKNQLLAGPLVSIPDHSLLKRICPLSEMSDQASLQPNHHTNSILLRRYWVVWSVRSKSSMFTDSAVKCNRIYFSFFRKIPRLSALVPRNMGWPHSAKCWSSDCPQCPIFLLAYESTFHTNFASLHFKHREMTNDQGPRWNLFAESLTPLEFEIQCNECPFFDQSMSLIIDMNRFLPSNCSGLFVEHPDLPKSFWDYHLIAWSWHRQDLIQNDTV